MHSQFGVGHRVPADQVMVPVLDGDAVLTAGDDVAFDDRVVRVSSPHAVGALSQDVLDELERRFGTSGLDEKASRKTS